jgi:hypothetical protein
MSVTITTVEDVVVDAAVALKELLNGRTVDDLVAEELPAYFEYSETIRRGGDVLGVQGAAVVQARSKPGDEDSLCRRWGERNPAALVASWTGLDPRETGVWCALSGWISPRMSLQGEVLPPEFPVLAAAVTEGRVSVAAAYKVGSTLKQIEPHVSLEDRVRAEETLVEHASRLRPRDLSAVCRKFPDVVNPDGSLPREEELRSKAQVRVKKESDGMVTWILTMDPETAGYLTTAVDARTAPRRRPVFTDTLDVEVTDDTRTLGQRRVQAIADIMKESLCHDTGQVAGIPVTMAVTISLENLLTGLGTATIAGVDEPISAETARRLAVNANIIPVVLGGESHILDLGRSRRLASPAQRIALAIRDGGCLWPGCEAPPGWCEVAHRTRWIDGGPTDLAELFLACPFHHHRYDTDRWELRWEDGIPWLIPPPHLDATRTPRRAGRPTLASCTG